MFSSIKKEVSMEYMFSDVWTNLWTNMDSFFGDARYTDNGDTVYELEVPGFNKNNLEVNIINGILTIAGKRETKNESHAGAKEIYKRFTISQAQDAEATIRNGILYLTIKNQINEKKKIELK